MSTASGVCSELLAILRCPESIQPVRLADESLVHRLLEQARKGDLKNLRGDQVPADFESLLMREDQKRAYVVREGIPIMLIDEAVVL